MDQPKMEMTAEAVQRRLMEFWTWNGDEPAPSFTHWTSRGTFMIRACTPGHPATTEVIFNGRVLGYGGFPPRDAENLVAGSYDKELGFRASDTDVPAEIDAWNNL